MPISYDTPTTSEFSITILLGSPSKEVTVHAGDVSKVATDGLHFELPEGTTVTLGTFSAFIAWINSKFGISIPTTSSADWPAPIKTIFDGVLGATVTVTRLTIDQAKKDADGKYPPMDVQLSVVATAAAPIDLISGLFQVSGAGVGVTRTHTQKAA